jgi:hypothetical protein
MKLLIVEILKLEQRFVALSKVQDDHFPAGIKCCVEIFLQARGARR